MLLRLTPILLFLPAGSCLFPTEPIADDRLWFCDAETEVRRFTQEEVDWRTANAPRNLRRDFQTNLTWERECLDEEEAPLTQGLSSTRE